MKRIVAFKYFIGVFTLLMLFASCNQNTENGDPTGYFKTREDSINFAKQVFKQYPTQLSSSFGFENKADSVRSANFKKSPSEPVDFKVIEDYAKYYDSYPVIKDVKGFMLDADEVALIKNNPNYYKIYFRLGKHSNDPRSNDYTVMVVPLGTKDEVLAKGSASRGMGDNSNYDELDPCPRVCPSDWDNK